MIRTTLLVSLLGLVMISMTAPGLAGSENSLLDVRIGPHKQFDRVVFEFQDEVPGRVLVRGDQRIEVRFANVHVPEHFSLPRLPRGLTVLKGIEAIREGDSNITFTISLNRDVSPSELPLAGRPWRLAIDLAPRVIETRESQPPYVPGDLPIPTRFAEQPAAPSDSVINSAQAHAILAYYYLAQGDTPSAWQEAVAYQQLCGEPLDLTLETEPQPPPPSPQAPTKFALPTIQFALWPVTPQAIGLALAFVVGVAGGLMLRAPIRRAPRAAREKKVKEPKIKSPKLKKPKRKKDLPAELAADLDALDQAAGEEPPVEPSAPAEPPKSKKRSEPEPLSDVLPPEAELAEKEVRESLMDRRVRRVLELTRQGATVSAIAEELQMGQDEVRLILDLNK
jgi:hypothetical protein